MKQLRATSIALAAISALSTASLARGSTHSATTQNPIVASSAASDEQGVSLHISNVSSDTMDSVKIVGRPGDAKFPILQSCEKYALLARTMKIPLWLEVAGAKEVASVGDKKTLVLDIAAPGAYISCKLSNEFGVDP